MKTFLLAAMLTAAHAAPCAQWDPYRTTAAIASAERARIDATYLTQARASIERIRKSDAVLQVAPGAQVEIDQISQDFLFGNLAEDMFHPAWSADERASFERHFTALFNFTELTLVKWARYEPRRGQRNDAELSRQLDWAARHGITVKGHTIGWSHNAGTPGWLYGMPHGAALAAYEQQVGHIVGAYKDRIRSWDAVNEPVTTIPYERALQDIRGDGKIDDGPRYDTTGVTLEQTVPWVENTLRRAHRADPTGQFHINEFHILSKPAIRAKYVALIEELQKRKAPLHGIGIQAHEPREMWFATPEIVKAFDQLHALGLPLHITEFIPQSSGKPITGGWRAGPWTEEAQAEFAEQFYTLAFAHPGMRSIHWWGMSDKSAWLAGGGLLDARMQPKPAYRRLYKLIKEDWMTRGLRLRADSRGEVAFRGFYGRYRVRITLPDGSVRQEELHLREQGEKRFTLTAQRS